MAPGELDSRIQSTDQNGNTAQIYPDFNNSTQDVEKKVQVPSYDINKHIKTKKNQILPVIGTIMRRPLKLQQLKVLELI